MKPANGHGVLEHRWRAGLARGKKLLNSDYDYNDEFILLYFIIKHYKCCCLVCLLPSHKIDYSESPPNIIWPYLYHI